MAGPSFQFRLERVRSLRERNRRLAEQELASAIGRRMRSQDELRSTESHLLRAQSQQRSVARSRTLSAVELIAGQAYLERIEADRGQRTHELAQHEAEVARRDAQLATAASEHQVLNRLRERHRCEHDREQARREQGILDEIASVRFRRSAS